MSEIYGFIVDEPPMPERADFGITIDFVKGTGNPQRVFRAATAIIDAMQELDVALASMIGPEIEPVLVLEDVKTGSLKIWLRNRFENIDDQALRELDWKRQVGSYLVYAKYAFIEWTNEGEKASLASLRKRLFNIAEATDIRKFPAYAPPDTQSLVSVIGKVEAAKGHLLPADRVVYETRDQPKLTFDPAGGWTRERLEIEATKETITHPAGPMILTVKKPDYLGNSRWEFKHGKRTIAAKIEDSGWLNRFHARSADANVRPGDALRCNVRIEQSYGFDNDLISEKYFIAEITKVLVNHEPHPDLFDE